MKLIDADELMEKIYSVKYLRKIKSKQLIDECKRIDAIPVEWLLNHIPHDEPMEAYNKKLIEYLVIVWRKENE